MNKELDRLEHLRIGIQYINQDKSPAFISQYEEDIDIIEKALKRQEELDSLYTLTNHNGKFYVIIDKAEFNQMSKQLKALEIIKEKNVNVPKLRNSSNLEEYNRCFRDKCLLTQEEYELLKEVLL